MTDLLLDAIAVYRLTRLGVEDSLLDEPRDAVLRWASGYERPGEPGPREPTLLQRKVEELIGCPWCMSAHLALLVVLLRRRAPRLWGPLARALAFSAVAGMVSTGVDLVATTSELADRTGRAEWNGKT